MSEGTPRSASEPTVAAPLSLAQGAASLPPFAVIDIGTASIRMTVAETDAQGEIHLLDSFEQAVALGKTAFTRGSISRKLIEECVRILKSFREALREYQVEDPSRIRAVATSALREASNAADVVDRIYIATGIQVEVIDEAEVNRLTYLGVLPSIHGEPELQGAPTLVIEVGGGGTEWLLVQNDDVFASHAFRLGSLRLRESLESFSGPPGRLRKMMESSIQASIEQAAKSFPDVQENLQMVALGGDVRFAASEIDKEWKPDRLAKLPLTALSKFTDTVLGMSVDELVRRFRLTYPAAETLGPALLSNVLIARRLKLKQIWVTRATLRDGLNQEIASRGAWSENFRNQILRSARSLGQRYQYDEAHGQHVAGLASRIFHALQDEHRLEPRHELILHVAGLLHEVGLYVSNRSHHKHSMYLIQNSDLFGVGRRDLLLVALVARYHRRASPRPDHEGYVMLDRASRIAVVKMAALLRVADALDRSHSQRVRDIQCRRVADRLTIQVPGLDDLSLEQLAVEQKGTMFEEVFGMKLDLEALTGTEALA